MCYRTNAPWGLSRLSQNAAIRPPTITLNKNYTFDDSAGQGVDIYILGQLYLFLMLLAILTVAMQILVSLAIMHNGSR
jgi:hypothetical protein